jgi:hypothetical protein
LGQPEPAEVERLESILAALVAPDEAERRGAAADVATVHAGLVAAIARRLDRVADGANRSAMKEVLLETRRLARDDARRALRESGGKGEIETPDYFEMVVAHADPTKVAWRDLVQVLAMSRMLVAIETVEAVRVLVEVYARFSFLRVDTQLQLEKLGDRAVAGLIEARRHRAAEVARWAERQLDALGRAIPGEAVQVRDPEALADVLRAYGRLRDPDAARIVVSFANSERARVREAARQAITLMGEVGTWQLRDAYENTVGKRAPRDWSWQRLARELFAAFDRQRLSQVHELYEQGRAAEARGDLRGMRRAYDMVLTRSPLFDRRGAMAAGYLAYAIRFADEDAAAAEMALDRAARIADDPAVRTRIESLRLTLRAERLRDEGIFDQELLQRAADLDATNPRPRRLLATVSNDPDAAAGARHRWIARRRHRADRGGGRGLRHPVAAARPTASRWLGRGFDDPAGLRTHRRQTCSLEPGALEPRGGNHLGAGAAELAGARAGEWPGRPRGRRPGARTHRLGRRASVGADSVLPRSAANGGRRRHPTPVVVRPRAHPDGADGGDPGP